MINTNIPFILTPLNKLWFSEVQEILTVMQDTPLEELYDQEMQGTPFRTLKETLVTTDEYPIPRVQVATIAKITNSSLEDNVITIVRKIPKIYAQQNLLKDRVKDQFIYNLRFYQNTDYATINGYLSSIHIDNDYDFHAYSETDEGLGFEYDCNLLEEKITVSYSPLIKTWAIHEGETTTDIQLLSPTSNCFQQN